MLIQNINDLALNAPKTYLSANFTGGGGTLSVKNSTGFTNQWAIQVGKTGNETTEIALGTVSDIDTLFCAALNFDHPADTPVYAIKYNQVVFERSTAGTAGTASPLTSGTITYQADNQYTIFDDTSGSVSYAYKTLYRNSALSAETTESDWITITPSFYSLAVIRDRTKEKLWDSSFVNDTAIDQWTNEFKDKLTNFAIQSNEDYSLGTVDVGFGTEGLGTITVGDFKQPRRVWVTYNGADFYQSTKQDSSNVIPGGVYSVTHPLHNWFGDDILTINPGENGGTARVMYYKQGTAMVNDTDELPRFMRGYTDGFVEYNLIQAQYKDSRITMSNKKGAESTLVGDFITQLAPRDKTGVTYVHLNEVISGDDNL